MSHHADAHVQTDGPVLPDRAPTPVRTPPEGAHALVVGATGITGAALVQQLVSSGWRTTGLSRRPGGVAGAGHVAADLTSRDSLERALEIAARVPAARLAQVEVRPLMHESDSNVL